MLSMIMGGGIPPPFFFTEFVVRVNFSNCEREQGYDRRGR